MIRLFPNIPSIQNRNLRRAVMALVSPLVFIEYIVNGGIGFFMDFRQCWKL